MIIDDGSAEAAPSPLHPATNQRFYRGAPQPAAAQPKSQQSTKGIDFNNPGSINGTPVLEYNLDSSEEKPWRQPGLNHFQRRILIGRFEQELISLTSSTTDLMNTHGRPTPSVTSGGWPWTRVPGTF